jgi:DNA-binding IclR family transcriptional regulator
MSEHIKSLAKALTVLEFLGQFPNGISLQKISEATAMTKSSVHRILATFEMNGYVTQLSSNKEYRLTMKLMHLGQTAMNSDVIGIVKPYLSKLLDTLNETVNFLSFEGDKIVFKDKLEPQNASFRTRTYVGMYSPKYCSAAGKCALAFTDDNLRESYWQRNSSVMKQLTDNTILDKKQFFNVLDNIKKNGFGLDDEENEAGISCVAVPICDKNGTPIYAVSVSALTPKMKDLGYETIATEIKKITAKLEKKLF